MSLNLDRLVRRWFAKVAGLCLAVLALNAAVYVFGVARLGRRAEQEGTASQAGKKALEAEEARSRKVAAQVKVFQDGRAVLETLTRDHLKTQGERMTEAQGALRTLLSEAGLTSDSVTYDYDVVPMAKGREAPPRQYLRLRARFKASGSYPQIKTFLVALQASPHFFVAEELALATSSQGAVLINLNATVATYFLLVPAQAPRAGGAP